MSRSADAVERLAPLLSVPLPAATGEPFVDLVEGHPGSRGRIQDLWESVSGAGVYDLVLASGERVRDRLPGALGGLVRDFYAVDRRLELAGGETVLDLACGQGTHTRRLAEAVGPSGLVVAADLSAPMLRRAAQAVSADTAVLVRADAMDIPLRDDTVDALCCSLCLHLVPDLDTAIAQIARVLRPGGRLALAVPAHGPGPTRWVTEFFGRAGEMRMFRRGELADALVRHGFGRVVTRWESVMQIVDAVAPGAAHPRG